MSGEFLELTKYATKKSIDSITWNVHLQLSEYAVSNLFL